MKIIKVNAIASTNSFLKELSQTQTVENFTVVMAKNQTEGRGQGVSKWVSQEGKNLTISIFCQFKNLKAKHQKYLNFAVSLSVFQALQDLKIPKVMIKWPNDILSGKQKLCGILVENILVSDNIQSSIIGIGLNVNQVTFPAEVPNATSLKLRVNKTFDLDTVLDLILTKLKKNSALLTQQKYEYLETAYLNHLYKKDIPSMFKDTQNRIFMGKIIGVSPMGKLQIELADETIKTFGVKEVAFL